MKNSDLVRIQYSAKQASIANAWKKWIGQIDGLKQLDAVSIKIKQEKEYSDRAKSNREWNTKYGSLVEKMNELVAQKSDLEFQYAMGAEYFSYGPEYFKLARGMNDLISNYSKYKEKGELKAVIDKLKISGEGFFKNYDEQVDKKIFRLMTLEYFNQTFAWKELTKELPYSITENWRKSYCDDLTEDIYTKSIFTSKDRFLLFLDKFSDNSMKKLQKDKGFEHYTKYISNFKNNIVPAFQLFSAEMTALLQVYVEGKLIMFPDAKHWPDANSTLRISYGKLEGSAPTDGMMYTEHTTLDGIVTKYNTGNPDFELLPKILELHKTKDFGPYAQNGELWVCFTGSNHTTGGNSGSPVLDENGYLMGLNFDRTWESTMSDYMFDARRCRNVVVDIRYVLWVMDKYSGAKHIVDEMTLMKE
jgi:hypothetical protein